MRRRSKAGGKPNKARPGKRVTLKRPSAPKVSGRRNPSSTNANTKIALLERERDEALEQQKATAEVLQIISNRPGDLDSVFQSVLANAVRLCDATFGVMYRYDDQAEAYTAIALFEAPAALEEHYHKRGAFSPVPGSSLDHVARTGGVVNKADASAEPAPGAPVIFGGARSLTCVPMAKDSRLIGAITIYRQEVRPFTAKQVSLVQNFAAQAVIAIENTRLLNDLRQRTDDLTESLENQTATGEILGVISKSPTQIQPVFDIIAASALRLCGAAWSAVLQYNGEQIELAALHNLVDFDGAGALRRTFPRKPSRTGATDRAVSTRSACYIPDVLELHDYDHPTLVQVARSVLSVPMLRDGQSVGAITVCSAAPNAFTDRQMTLLRTFADQAVIAIENVRLFEAEQQRTRELAESLEQQTATSEVLSVISSSPGELEPVFQAMLENATRICEANISTLFLAEQEGYRAAAMHNATPEHIELRRREPVVSHPDNPLLRVGASKQTLVIGDVFDDVAYRNNSQFRDFIEASGARSLLQVPLLKEGQVIGVLSIYRQEVRPFADKQISLLENFAAQAVIAIENTRLLNELRKSLEQQTATSEVLGVISSSPGDLEPVFQAMMANATRICEAKFGILQLQENGRFRNAAMFNPPPALAEYRHREPVINAGPQSAIGRVAATKQLVHIVDYAADPAYIQGDPAAVNMVERAGARTVLLVPMLKDGEHIGNLNIYRQEVRPFTDKQIELVKNFAAQAVIAIENTRLLNELRQRTDRSHRVARAADRNLEVLKIISGSPGMLQPVFDAVMTNATRLCDAKFGGLFLAEGDKFRCVAMYNLPRQQAEMLQREPLVDFASNTGSARAMSAKRVVQIEDLTKEPGYIERNPRFVNLIELGGARSAVFVPLVKDAEFDRCHGRLSTGSGSFHRQADRVGTELRRPGRHRHREHAAAQRIARNRCSSRPLPPTCSRSSARSPGELEPVFEAMLENATRICEAKFGSMSVREGDEFRTVAMHGVPKAYAESTAAYRSTPSWSRYWSWPRQCKQKQVVHIGDVDCRPSLCRARSAAARCGRARRRAHPSFYVPLLKDNEVIGIIVIYRQEVRPFTDKQIELVKNFAAQAVIAIENTRLLNELRQRPTI